MHPRVREEELLNTGAVLALSLIYWIGLALNPNLGVGATPGWWGWYDQGEYLRPIHSVWSGIVGPWHYQPLYSVGAGLFSVIAKLPLFSVHPADVPEAGFYLFDFACLLASALFFIRIGKRIGVSFAGPVFLAVAAIYPPWFEGFVIPWTSTVTVPLIYAVYIVCLRPAPKRTDAVLLVAVAVLIVLSRPSDLAAVAPAAAYCLYREGRAFGRVRTGLIAIAGVGALAVALFGWGAISGTPPLGPYFAMAQANGVTLSSLAYKALAIFNDSGDFGVYGESILEHSPLLYFVLLGGLLAPLAVALHKRRLAPVLWIVLSCLCFLALALVFNELHPANLFRFLLFHYFKFLLPLALLFWIYAALNAPLAAGATGALVAGLMFIGIGRQVVTDPCPSIGPNTFTCDSLHGIRVLRLKLNQDAPDFVSYGAHTAIIDGRTLHRFSDFRLYYDTDMRASMVFHVPIDIRDLVLELSNGLVVESVEQAVATTP